MKDNLMLKGMGLALNGIVKDGVPDAAKRKEIRKGYKEIMDRASDIGSSNILLSSYGLAAYFISMNKVTGFTPEKNCEILERGMRKSKLIKAMMGDAKGYFDEKRMVKRREWSKETHQRKYKNDWVVDILEKTDDYEFGMDYTECGVVKLCRDEGCPELAKYMCSLDFMLAEIMGLHLDRTMTLAEGAPKCDFRYSRAK